MGTSWFYVLVGPGRGDHLYLSMVDHNIGVGVVLYRLWGNNFDFLRMIVGVNRIDTLPFSYK